MGERAQMLVAITLSYDCVKKPRCSFCYLKTQQAIRKLQGFKDEDKSIYSRTHDIAEKVGEILKSRPSNDVTIAYEYNGIGLQSIEQLQSVFGIIDKYEKPYMFKNHHFTSTMTTMPQAIWSPVTPKWLASIGISAISLSFDSQKVHYNEEHRWNISEWMRVGKWIKDAGLALTCNYLIEPKIGIKVPIDVIDLSDQINFLSLKPTGKLEDKLKSELKLSIMTLNTIKPVTVDNCLGVQLGYVSKCLRGKEFVHIYPDASVSDCCFEGMCFLWSKNGK